MNNCAATPRAGYGGYMKVIDGTGSPCTWLSVLTDTVGHLTQYWTYFTLCGKMLN